MTWHMYMTYDIQHTVHGTQYMVYNTQHMVCSIWHTIHSWHILYITRNAVQIPQDIVYSINYTAHIAQHTVPLHRAESRP